MHVPQGGGSLSTGWGGAVGREEMEKIKRYLGTSQENEIMKLFPKLHLVLISTPPLLRLSRLCFLLSE